MRIFAIAKVLLLYQVKVALRGMKLGFLAQLATQPTSNGAVVGIGGLEHLESKLYAGIARGSTIVGTHFFKNGVIALRLGYHGNALEILRSRAQHGRAADVNVLDAGAELSARLDRLFEGIQVHNDHIDHADAVFFRLAHMLGIVALGKKTAMHLGMQRFHTAVHHLRKSGQIVARTYGNASLFDNLGRSARGNDFHTELLVQRTSEINNARLVGHRHERTLDFRICHLDTTFPCNVFQY